MSLYAADCGDFLSSSIDVEWVKLEANCTEQEELTLRKPET